MKLHKPTKLQVYTFIASMPLIDFVLNYIMYDDRIFTDYKIWLFSFPLIYVIGIGSWYTHCLISSFVNKRYPTLQQTRLRILILSLSIVPFMSACVTLIFFLYDGISLLGYTLSYDDLKLGLVVGFCVNLIFETLYQADYVLERYKESVEEKEMLQQLSMEQEFDTLKSQVNPHFLFNCFNTLSSLISEDHY